MGEVVVRVEENRKVVGVWVVGVGDSYMWERVRSEVGSEISSRVRQQNRIKG